MSFIFNPEKGETPETLRRKRQMAAALMARRRAPKDVGEGLSELGNAIAFRRTMGSVKRGEEYGQQQANEAFSPIVAALGGEGPSQASHGGGYSGDMDTLKSGIQQTAESLQMDPVDLATIISYETGGTFDPMQKGPTTQWGQHQGLIQFGEPQAKQYGVDWERPVESQLGPDGAIANYYRDNGWKPGMSMLDAYSIVNAGGPGRYNASDAHNGGAPGSVRDKVNEQMAGHRAKAQAMFGGDQPEAPRPGLRDRVQGLFERPQQEQPQQVAQAERQPGSLGLPQLLQAAQNPWLAQNPMMSGIVRQLIDIEVAKQAPMSQQDQIRLQTQKVQLEKALLEVERMQQPEQPDAPSGYRFTPDGSLEAIPGGPAAVKQEAVDEKQEARTDASLAQADRLIAKVDEALGNVGTWTAGAGGSVAGMLPGTPARDLAADLETIKANLGFAELQAMRDASPTGGALGQVAVQELVALQSTVASLDQAQSPEALRKGLEQVRTHYENWKNAVMQSRNGGQPEQGGPQPGMVEDGFRFKGGDPADPNNWEPAQ